MKQGKPNPPKPWWWCMCSVLGFLALHIMVEGNPVNVCILVAFFLSFSLWCISLTCSENICFIFPNLHAHPIYCCIAQRSFPPAYFPPLPPITPSPTALVMPPIVPHYSRGKSHWCCSHRWFPNQCQFPTLSLIQASYLFPESPGHGRRVPILLHGLLQTS